MGLFDWLKKVFSDDAAPVRDGESKTARTKTPTAPTAPVRHFSAPKVLGLSKEEFRKRALKISPWRTAWIGRVDVIPPASDERTAIIDRGLVLHGKITEAELEELHEVGDLWLHYHDAVAAAQSEGRAAGAAAVEALREERKKRREEKKRAAEAKREKHKDDVARRHRTDITFLGRGVSFGLANRRTNVERLNELGLPVLATPADVAAHLDITIEKLRWLAFHQDAAERRHYVDFEVPKRSGGTRRLSAPHRELKAVQQRIRTTIVGTLEIGPPAHGFVKGRSTVTNAKPHVGRAVIVNMDLVDFFGTVTFVRVRGLFERFGYSPAAATILALLTTEAERRPVVLNGVTYHVAVKDRALPQGAPTSPAISNLVARRLDKRLTGLAASAGYEYTRYADDLSLSAGADGAAKVPWLIRQVRAIVEAEGFAVNTKKTRVQRRGGRQAVTGVVVNDKLGLPRTEVRQLRAILHNARHHGLAAQNREERPDFPAYLRGKIAYLAMVDPTKGRPMLEALDRLEGRN